MQLSIIEFAAKCKTHPVTVRRWLKAHRIEGRKNFKGVYEIPATELKKVTT